MNNNSTKIFKSSKEFPGDFNEHLSCLWPFMEGIDNYTLALCVHDIHVCHETGVYPKNSIIHEMVRWLNDFNESYQKMNYSTKLTLIEDAVIEEAARGFANNMLEIYNGGMINNEVK